MHVLIQPPMRYGMLVLAVSQALHSLEEYRHSLWEVFEPARLASNFVSSNTAAGFVAINVSVVALAFWTYLVPVTRNWASAKIFVWFWVILEVGNSIAHIALAASARGYFPGAYTAPLLLVVSCYVALKLIKRTDYKFER